MPNIRLKSKSVQIFMTKVCSAEVNIMITHGLRSYIRHINCNTTLYTLYFNSDDIIYVCACSDTCDRIHS